MPDKHILLLIDYTKAFDSVGDNKLWEILKKRAIPDYLTCLLRNLYAGQEATLRTGHGTTDCSKLRKEYVKPVYCHHAYLTYMQNTSCEMLDWMKHKLESRLPGEISINSGAQMATPLWQKVKNYGSSWWKWKRRVKKLKFNSQKTKVMAFSPITSWQIDGKTMEAVTDFIFGGSKITADVDCSHEIKRHLLLGRKTMTNLDSILDSRDITLSTNVNLIKAMFFSSSHVWMLELDSEESWVLKNLWFWTVGLERTLTRWNQLILKEINPECPLVGLMLKLKLHYVGTWCKELTP